MIRARKREDAGRQPLAAGGDLHLVEPLLACQPRQGTGLREGKARVVAGLPNQLGKEEGAEGPRRQEHDLPVGEKRGQETGDIELRKGRRRTYDQLGSANRRAHIGRHEIEGGVVPAAKILEPDGAGRRAMRGHSSNIAPPHPHSMTGKRQVCRRREGPVAAAQYSNSHESPLPSCLGIGQTLPCMSRLRCRSVRFCSSSDCASTLRSPRIDTTHSSCRRAMRRKLSRPLRVSRTITLRRSRGSSWRITNPPAMSLSTSPVMAPFDTIRRRDKSDMVRPSGKRSSCARTSKRDREVLNSLRRRWLRRLSILTEQASSRSQTLSSKCSFCVAARASSTSAAAPLERPRPFEEEADFVMDSLMLKIPFR